MSIRILIADNQEGVRSAFRMVLDAQPDMEVVAEAPDGATALERARRLRPDVVIADIRMPTMDGLELTKRLTAAETPNAPKVVVVTTFDLDTYVHEALRNGAAGFLLKRSGPTLLIEAVRAAVAGDTLISPQLTVRLLSHLTNRSPQPTAPTEPLTPREHEIATLVAKGHSNTEIAADLYISPGTVKNHLATIQRKLKAKNRVAIAAWTWTQTHPNPLP